MKETLIQHYYYNVPATTGTNVYTYLFKSDELYNYLTGVACPLITALTSADLIEIELRDDFKSILSFSPVRNWCKSTTAQTWNLQEVFRPFNVASKGKNFYLNVKVTNSAAAFSFCALFRQSNAALKCRTYDMQTFTFKNVLLGANNQINLPSDYDECCGVFITGGDTANDGGLLIDINDNRQNLLDPVLQSVLRITENTPFDDSFFPCEFVSKNKQVFLRITALHTSVVYTPSDISVTFLLIKK